MTESEPQVEFWPSEVVMDFTNGALRISGRLEWKGGPAPEVLWIWAYFLNPSEPIEGSRSDRPLKVLHPLRGQKAADVTAKGRFHWWNNPDVPRSGYFAKVTVSASSRDDAEVPIEIRDYTAFEAIPVVVIS